MFNSKAKQITNSPSYRANNAQQIKADKVNANDTNSHMPDYFRSSINRAVDKGVSQVLIEKIHNEFSDVFFRDWLF